MPLAPAPDCPLVTTRPPAVPAAVQPVQILLCSAQSLQGRPLHISRPTALPPFASLAQIKYIARTAAKGGLPSDASCTQKGGKERIPYSGTWDFLAC